MEGDARMRCRWAAASSACVVEGRNGRAAEAGLYAEENVVPDPRAARVLISMSFAAAR